jgi:hypothetical protein
VVPFFATKKIGDAARDVDGRIYPFSSALSIYFLSTLDSCSVSLYRGCCLSLALGTKGISWSYSRCSGSELSGFSKTS